MFSRASKDTNKVEAKASGKPKMEIPSVISEDMNILGNIISDGYIDINGNVEGNVKCKSVTVRERGYIRGDVVAETVNIYGEVDGLIKAKNVHLFSTCKIAGVIMHESMSVEDGAFIDGQCKRMDRVLELESASSEVDDSNVRFLSGRIF